MKSKLPPAFREYITRLYLLQRHHCTRYVYRFLLIRWQLWSDGNAGNEIPGYDTPPPAGKGNKPAGWSERSFAACKPDMTVRTGTRRTVTA